jgi:ribokinase
MQAPAPRVLVVGSYATGLVMETERLPLRGETLIGHSYRAGHGGKGSNQAVQAARLGADVTFITRVGRDGFGDAMEALMRSEGVRPDGLQRDDKLPTGVGFIIVDKQGNNLITVDLGANQALSEGVLAQMDSAFAEAAIVLTQLEIPLATALAAMQAGRRHGKITVLNPAPAADLSRTDLSCIDFITPNETEALVCAGMADGDPAEAARRLLQGGCGNVVLTVGEKGCVWFTADGRETAAPGFAVAAMDTVGAGDAFSAAFVVALAGRQPVAEALRFANAAAALSVTKPDTIPSYHNRAQVEALLKT